jgi:ribosomal protein S18 acetylase RimI-like enzyme
MTDAEYALEALDALPPRAVADVRRIYEEGFPPHQRAEFNELTSERQDGEFSVVLTGHGQSASGQPCGFAMLRPLGRTGLIYLRYFVVDHHQRGQGLGGILWDRLTGLLRADGYELLVFDVDDPAEPGQEPDEVSIRSRRIGFYERHGARLLPVSGYRTPDTAGPGKEPEWTPMLLMTADLSGGPAASRPRLADRQVRAVVDAVYRYRWELDPGHPRFATILINSQ